VIVKDMLLIVLVFVVVLQGKINVVYVMVVVYLKVIVIVTEMS